MGSMVRFAVSLAFAVAAVFALAPTASAEPRHGLSIFGDLKYPADFKHFDYVNPDAPKGGKLVTIGTGASQTFDSFNDFIYQGEPAQGLGLIFDSLMTRAYDEPDADYGLIAETADVAADKMSVTFRLRPEARFADGKPVTASDCVFTFDTLKSKGHPRYGLVLLADVEKAEALDPLTVRYTFKGTQVRDLPNTVAELPVLSKDWYANRKFDETSLDRPLGSGPYEIGDFKAGGFVVYKRRPDYWAKDLPVNVGRYNFDVVRYEYFRDRTVGLEALKGGVLNFREEFSSRDWATAYDIPQVKDGRIIVEKIPDEVPSGTQGFFLNLRRDKFKDMRVRKALDLAFDFEWTKKTLFYGQYQRVQSYFENSDLKAAGKPSVEELALLEPWRGKVPEDVFGEVYMPPVSDGSGQDRKLLKQARDLLKDAGFDVKGGVLTGRDGKPFAVEFLGQDPSDERFMAPYVKNLKLLGFQASIRLVESAQYQERLKTFDFDTLVSRFVTGLTPGVELRNMFGSAAAKSPGTFNLAGISDPAVDDLIEKVAAARSRAELVTAGRVLDRVLRAGHYWVSNWYGPNHRLAYWNVFSRPAVKPRYDRGVTDTWWYDTAKADTIAKN